MLNVEAEMADWYPHLHFIHAHKSCLSFNLVSLKCRSLLPKLWENVLWSFNTTEPRTNLSSGIGKQMLSVVFKNLFRFMNSRPSTTEGRIQPSELRGHRQTHCVLGPGCLCPLLEASLPDFVESTIYMPTHGPWAGHYVAACARDRCAYIGKRELLSSD
jgi:hypothetical protein